MRIVNWARQPRLNTRSGDLRHLPGPATTGRRRAAIAIADGRFTDGKRLAAEARDRGVKHALVNLAYGAQVLAARLEEGRVTDVIASLEDLEASGVHLPAWRMLRIAALADNGQLDRAAAEWDNIGVEDISRLLSDDIFASLIVRYSAEICRRLSDRRASAWLPTFCRGVASFWSSRRRCRSRGG